MRVQRYIATGWFDGPEAGWLEGDDGQTYRFHLIALKVLEERDDKIFVLERIELPFDQIHRSFARCCEPPDRQFWWPIWRFDSEDQKLAANEMVQQLEKESMPVARFLVFDEDEFQKREMRLIPLEEHRVAELMVLLRRPNALDAVCSAFGLRMH